MQPSEVFRANLPLIEQVIAAVCRRGRLQGADAEDFTSIAMLALIDDDYAILRKWEGRSSLGGYLTAVLQRLFIDERVRSYGRWHPSAEAKRMGPAGMLLETLVARDRRTIDEALPALRAIDPAITRSAAEAMVQRFPERAPRPRAVEVETVESTAVATERADAAAIRAEAEQLARRTAQVVRDLAASLDPEDRAVLELRFAHSMPVAEIARAMRVPQRTLYRRLDELLYRLRIALTRAGLGKDVLQTVLESGTDALDFHFARWRAAPSCPSPEEEEGSSMAEESR